MVNFTTGYNSGNINVRDTKEIDLRPAEPAKTPIGEGAGALFSAVQNLQGARQQAYANQVESQNQAASSRMEGDMFKRFTNLAAEVNQGAVSMDRARIIERSLMDEAVERGMDWSDISKMRNSTTGDLLGSGIDIKESLEKTESDNENKIKQQYLQSLRDMNPLLFGGRSDDEILNISNGIQKRDTNIQASARAYAINKDDKANESALRNEVALSNQFAITNIMTGLGDRSSYDYNDLRHIRNSLEKISIDNGVDPVIAAEEAEKTMNNLGMYSNDTTMLAKEAKSRNDLMMEATKNNVLLDNPQILTLESMSSELRQFLLQDPDNRAQARELSQSIWDKSNRYAAPLNTDDKSLSVAGIVANDMVRNNKTATPEQRGKALDISIDSLMKRYEQDGQQSTQNLRQAMEENIKLAKSGNLPEGYLQDEKAQRLIYTTMNEGVKELDTSLVGKRIGYRDGKFIVTGSENKALPTTWMGKAVAIAQDPSRLEQGLRNSAETVSLFEVANTVKRLNDTLAVMSPEYKSVFEASIPDYMKGNEKKEASTTEASIIGTGISAVSETVDKIAGGIQDIITD